MDISACIITKNEKTNLEQCLRRLSGYGFELVVVDTGSADGTVPMARRYTDAIYDFQWCDDFAKAKNYAVSKASNDQVLIVDSDEFLEPVNVQEMLGQIRGHVQQVGRICRVNQIYQGNEIRESSEYINRLFDRRYFHFEGKIHEQVVALDGRDYETYLTTIVMKHTGYLLSEEDRKNKAERNIRMLERSLTETGDDPYILYQLGKSYYLVRDYGNACEYFGRALSFDLDPRLEYVIDMVDCYGYALLNSGQAAQALSFEGIYREFGVRADFQFLMGLIYMNNELFDQAIAEFRKAASSPDSRVKGVNSYLAWYNMGVVQECLERTDEAVASYRRCGDYQPALQRLRVLQGNR